MANPINTIIGEIPNTEDTYYLLVFDDLLYCSGSGGDVRRVDLTTNTAGAITGLNGGCQALVDFHRLTSVPPDFAGPGEPDRRIYIATGDGRIGEITPALFNQFRPLAVRPSFITCMVGTNSGKYLYFDDWTTDELSVVDLNADGGPRTVGTIQLGANATDLAISPDDRFIYASHGWAETVSVIDTGVWPPSVKVVPVSNGPAGLAISADGKRLFVVQSGFVKPTSVTGHGSGSLAVFDTTTMQGLWIFTGRASVAVAVNAAGTRAYVANRDEDTVSVVDVSDRPVVVDTITGFSAPKDISLSVDERHLYVAQIGNNRGVAVVAV